MIDQCIIKENSTFFIPSFSNGAMVNLDGFHTFNYDSELFCIAVLHRLTCKPATTYKPIYLQMHTHMCIMKQ